MKPRAARPRPPEPVEPAVLAVIEALARRQARLDYGAAHDGGRRAMHHQADDAGPGR